MSSKLKKSSLEKALASAASLQKQLFDNQAEVDYDFLVTINRVVAHLETELKYSRLKLASKIDLSSVDKLESTLFEFDQTIRRVCKEKRIKRYMQSTRVRRKLDQLNNSAYALVRALVRASADVPVKKEKEKSKDKKKAVKDDRFQILTVALTDSDAKRMWEDNWANEDIMVDWNSFQQALLKVLPTATEEDLGDVKYIIDNSATGEVTLNKFNEFVRGFGPLKDSPDNVKRLLSKSWFHGFLTSEESARLLELQPPGTFLVRFSKSRPGNFALAYVDKDKNVGHTLIQYTPSGFAVHENHASTDRNRVFPNLDQLVAHYTSLLKIPFDSTLTRSPWFHGDMDKDEAFDILNGKTSGSFLVRLSSKRGYLTISYTQNGEIQHNMIEPAEDGRGYKLQGNLYPSMDVLIEMNVALFTIPVETLIMGLNQKKVAKKVKAKQKEEKLIAASNYAALPPSSSDGSFTSGSEPATYHLLSADPIIPPMPSNEPIISDGRILGGSSDESLTITGGGGYRTLQQQPSNYGVFPDAIQRATMSSSSGSPNSSSSSFVLSSSNSMYVNASSNYGNFTDVPSRQGSSTATTSPSGNPIPSGPTSNYCSFDVLSGSSSSSSAPIRAPAAVVTTSPSAVAPHSNYGSFAPSPTNSPVREVKTNIIGRSAVPTTPEGPVTLVRATHTDEGGFGNFTRPHDEGGAFVPMVLQEPYPAVVGKGSRRKFIVNPDGEKYGYDFDISNMPIVQLPEPPEGIVYEDPVYSNELLVEALILDPAAQAQGEYLSPEASESRSNAVSPCDDGAFTPMPPIADLAITPASPTLGTSTANYGAIPPPRTSTNRGSSGNGTLPAGPTGGSQVSTNRGQVISDGAFPAGPGPQTSTNRSNLIPDGSFPAGFSGGSQFSTNRGSNEGAFPAGPIGGSQFSTNRVSNEGSFPAGPTGNQFGTNRSGASFPAGPSGGSQVSTNRAHASGNYAPFPELPPPAATNLQVATNRTASITPLPPGSDFPRISPRPGVMTNPKPAGGNYAAFPSLPGDSPASSPATPTTSSPVVTNRTNQPAGGNYAAFPTAPATDNQVNTNRTAQPASPQVGTNKTGTARAAPVRTHSQYASFPDAPAAPISPTPPAMDSPNNTNRAPAAGNYGAFPTASPTKTATPPATATNSPSGSLSKAHSATSSSPVSSGNYAAFPSAPAPADGSPVTTTSKKDEERRSSDKSSKRDKDKRDKKEKEKSKDKSDKKKRSSKSGSDTKKGGNYASVPSLPE